MRLLRIGGRSHGTVFQGAIHWNGAVEFLSRSVARSDDGGKTWEAVGNKFVYDGATGTGDCPAAPSAFVCVQVG